MLVNLVLSALALSWAAKISAGALMAVAMGGFLVRMMLVTGVVLLVRDQPWIDLVALAVTILVTHLGLLFWELTYVSASLAFPGLKPELRQGGLALVIFGIEFPPVSHAIEWPDIFGSGPFAVNKVVILMWLSVIIVFGDLPHRQPRLEPGSRRASRTSPSRPSTSSRRASSSRRWATTACGGRRCSSPSSRSS